MSRRLIRRRSSATGFTVDHLHPLLARVYASRELSSSAQLDLSLQGLLPFNQLSGIGHAVDLLVSALNEARQIVIVADFDADGATSCALAVRALNMMGAADVHFLVPNRFEFGYGLTPEIVMLANDLGAELIVTVDNGISSIEGVSAARQKGIQVLITDHHLPGATLPDAEAIVNPNQEGDTFPSKSMAGVGVIFYVMLALRSRLRELGWFSTRSILEPNLAQLLDLVALGTIADVVALDHNNRILVAQGLARIRRGQCCAGIRSLLDIAGRDYQRIVAADLGFAVGPRLNAAGRLEDMSLGIACLLTDSEEKARSITSRLDDLNRERRSIESQMQEQALACLAEAENSLEQTSLPLGLCLFDEEWHQGVIGILASRIKERLHRPVIAFAPGDGDEIKGSGRSIAGFHIRDALDEIAVRYPGLLRKFGGHAMAAGLTIKRQDLDQFQGAFDEVTRRHLDEEALQDVILSDGELAPNEICIEIAEVIRNAGPWGQGFPEPVFDGAFDVVERRAVGEKHLKMLLHVPDSETFVDAIAFNVGSDLLDAPIDHVRLAYRLDVNEYRGVRSAQLIVEHLDKQ